MSIALTGYRCDGKRERQREESTSSTRIHRNLFRCAIVARVARTRKTSCRDFSLRLIAHTRHSGTYSKPRAHVRASTGTLVAAAVDEMCNNNSFSILPIASHILRLVVHLVYTSQCVAYSVSAHSVSLH